MVDDALLARVRGVRQELSRSGPPWTRGHEGDFQRISFPERDSDALRDTLIAERVSTVVEVGLAYGASALAIGEALVTAASSKPAHVVIDAFQESEWSNAGWEVIQRAGLDGFTTLIAERSQFALPRLVSDGHTADAAFVDGSHIFHNVFVDLYFLRSIVRPGGLVVLDDVWTPSVATAARYFETNLGWTPVASALDNGTADGDGRTRGQAYRLPDPPIEPGFRDFKPF